MSKIEKDLLRSIAEKVGGVRGKRMKAKLGTQLPAQFAHLLENPLSDEVFATRLKNAEIEINRNGQYSDLSLLFTEIESFGEKPGTWGQPN
jgi:hypothetical protein